MKRCFLLLGCLAALIPGRYDPRGVRLSPILPCTSEFGLTFVESKPGEEIFEDSLTAPKVK